MFEHISKTSFLSYEQVASKMDDEQFLLFGTIATSFHIGRRCVSGFLSAVCVIADMKYQQLDCHYRGADPLESLFS